MWNKKVRRIQIVYCMGIYSFEMKCVFFSHLEHEFRASCVTRKARRLDLFFLHTSPLTTRPLPQLNPTWYVLSDSTTSLAKVGRARASYKKEFKLVICPCIATVIYIYIYIYIYMTYDKFYFNKAQNICFLLIRWVWMWSQQPRFKYSLIHNFNLFFT
jgi:hypothetical protein